MADIYDAMTSDRPYRAGWPPDRVNGLISELSGTHLNSRVVDVFLKTVAPYPIGTSVEVLSDEHTGYQGVVVDIDDAHLSRPKIRLLFDEAGERIGAINIDLRERGDVDVKSVRGPEPKMEPLGSSTPSDDDYEDDDEYEDGDDYEEDDIQFIEPEDA